MISMRSVTWEAKEDSPWDRMRHLRHRSRHRYAPNPNSLRSDSIRIGIRRKRGSPLRLTSGGRPQTPNSGLDEFRIVEDFDLKQMLKYLRFAMSFSIVVIVQINVVIFLAQCVFPTALVILQSHFYLLWISY